SSPGGTAGTNGSVHACDLEGPCPQKRRPADRADFRLRSTRAGGGCPYASAQLRHGIRVPTGGEGTNQTGSSGGAGQSTDLAGANSGTTGELAESGHT